MNDYPKATTEDVLTRWRYGPAQAERLCAGLLAIEGYQSIDPQCPLGGPDGLKDVICEKDGWKYVAAVYFPPKSQGIKSIRRKFDHDLGGVAPNECDGLLFFVNQSITPGERKDLIAAAEAKGHIARIYHVERIRVLLDAPRGFGLRLEFLRIAMSIEDQASFWSSWKNDVIFILQQQERSFRELSGKIDQIFSTQSVLLNMIAGRRSVNVSAPKTELLTENAATSIDFGPSGSSNLSVNLLLMIHRAVSLDFALPEMLGHLRKAQVWIGGPGSTLETASYVPPPPDDVPKRLKELIDRWNTDYAGVCALDHATKCDRIADFHHGFLSIHPFLDANGRVARVLMLQQASDLLRTIERVSLKENAAYISALQKGHAGNPVPLRTLVRDAFLTESDGECT